MGICSIAINLVMTALLGVSVPGICTTGGTTEAARPVPGQDAHNVVLIIADGMHNVNEKQYSYYQYGADRGACFHSWPYQACLTTWDVTTYDMFAWDDTGGSDAQDAGRYDPAGFDPATGYDPARGGVTPAEGPPSDSDAYFITGLPRWGQGAADWTREPATDSAAAATAFSTGHKTDYGNVAWLSGDPPDGALETIAEQFRDQVGGSVGAASTVQFSHATPACFMAHNVNRSDYRAIATEILTESQFDVIIGAGHPAYTLSDGEPTDRYCPVDSLAAIRANPDYVVVEKTPGTDNGLLLRRVAAQAAAEGRKLCGIFGGPWGNMEAIMPCDTPGQPTWDIPTGDPHASDIAVAALTVLSTNERGFFLMVEQGDLDRANHATDYAGAVGCLRDADLCARAVVDWINRDGDAITLENTSVIVVPDHTHYIRQATFPGIGDLPEQVAIEDDAESYEGSYRYPDGEPYYHSTNHTNELGNIYVIGGGVGAILAGYEGDWYPGTRIVDNTQVYQAMAEWLGIE